MITWDGPQMGRAPNGRASNGRPEMVRPEMAGPEMGYTRFLDKNWTTQVRRTDVCLHPVFDKTLLQQ